ncbi:MAG: Trans-hexaprenyltranstransferase [Magnetococcales bacterium]|nr:Trans-hexaprenyltranstransferase [Magnetococcales bacterium]HIJ85051.1 polyprenyl synthetase family protein [Magnetococcales bacterium]
MDAFVQSHAQEAPRHQGRSVRSQDQSVLDYLHDVIGTDLGETNEVILEKLDSQVPLIPELGSHLINSGGKRLRPILTLLSTRMFGYRGKQHHTLAAVVEFIHTATLLHDDVVDESLTRRGRQTANAVWGSKAPVLVGDFLFSRAFQMLVDHGDLRVLKVIADACAVISEGEVMQLLASNNLATDENQYMEVVARKTATLFAAAARMGAILNLRPAEDEENLARYGLLLGQAYQVVDDTLDYSATRETLGKGIGDDFQEGKITLPLIHAYHHGSEEERRFWVSCIEDRNQPPGSLERAIELVRQRGSLDYAMGRARSLADEAAATAVRFPASRERDALVKLATFSVDRHH